MHAYIVMLDNQNTIPDWAADTLCRLVTGEADSKRRLYTDDEDFVIELRRAVLLNGINVPTDRGDVLDRSLVVELERIPDGERKTEEELWERFEAEHPKLLWRNEFTAVGWRGIMEPECDHYAGITYCGRRVVGD